MSEGDIFREVDAEMRRDQLAQYWREYGVYVIAAALLIVASVGGYQGWQWWQANRAASDGGAFVEAAGLQESNKHGAAKKTFSELGRTGAGGYSALAELRLAAIAAAQGKKQAAVKAYDKVAGSTDDAMLRGFARIQAATLRVDDAPVSEMERRLEGMQADSNPWRHSARELLALSAYKADQDEKARKLYQSLLSDSGTPAAMRRRAEMMLSLITAPGDSTTGAATKESRARTQ